MNNFSDKIKLNPKKCKKEIASGWQYYQCQNKPKLDGYCLKHHPDRVAEKRKKRDAMWEREWLERDAWSEHQKWKKYQSIKAEILEGKTLIGTCGDCKFYDPTVTQIDIDNCSKRIDFWQPDDGCIKWEEKTE